MKPALIQARALRRSGGPALHRRGRIRTPPRPACWRRLAAASALLALLSWPWLATAQGTWLHTQCLAGTGDTGPCQAPPAWGQTGVEHVLALAATAGPGNLGLSLVKPETLPTANAARAQLAAVMLGYLDSGRPAAIYRWFGPVAPLAVGSKVATPAGTGLGTAATLAAAGVASAPPPTAAPAPPAAQVLALQTAWLVGALGDDPQAHSAGWWLANPYLGLVPPVQVDSGADPYRVLRFLAAQCPQLEGKVAPNAWTRCTTHNVPEPGSTGLVAVALLVACTAWRLGVRRRTAQAC